MASYTIYIVDHTCAAISFYRLRICAADTQQSNNLSAVLDPTMTVTLRLIAHCSVTIVAILVIFGNEKGINPMVDIAFRAVDAKP
jgi:hypothetical protein